MDSNSSSNEHNEHQSTKKISFDFLCLHNNENTEKDGETKTECQETCYSGRINNQANSPNPKPGATFCYHTQLFHLHIYLVLN